MPNETTTEEPDIPKDFNWYPYDPLAIQRRHERRMTYAWVILFAVGIFGGFWLVWRL